MDLNTIETVVAPHARSEFPAWQAGDAWLAGGTWLFSEPQPTLQRLIDLSRLGWPPHEITESGLTLAATCTIAQLDRLELPASWIAAPLIGQCCRALLGSFKIWTLATVGGNICMALPAGPMTSLTVALDGVCTVWAPDGTDRHARVVDFVLGPQKCALEAGEIVRAIHLPAAALSRRTAFRQISLSPNGRSGALLIGTLDAADGFSLTVTASTRRPVQLPFAQRPTADALQDALHAAIPDTLYYDDVHGAPDWRRHMTAVFAEEIRAELGGRA